MSSSSCRHPVRTTAAIIKAAKQAGAVSITLPDGTVVRFVDDAPSTATDQAPATNEWASAKPL
jgi:hypothetical protein